MHFIRDRVLAGDFLVGVWCNMASTLSVEIAAKAGYDWLLIDQEHAPGDTTTLLGQLQAVGQLPCAPLVRLPWNERILFKRALDLGASGVMVPFVESEEDARRAIRYLRYPPEGERGAALSIRAGNFGADFAEYFSAANANLLSVHQIETAKGAANVESIAAVDGVDALFVGPLDLSISVGMPKRFDDPEFRMLLGQIARGAKGAGKAAGILLQSVEQADMAMELGFTFVAVGSDSGMVAANMRKNRQALEKYRVS